MDMQVSVKVDTPADFSNAAVQLRALASRLDGAQAPADARPGATAAPAAEPKKRGRPKSEPVAVAPAPDDDADSLGEEETEDDGLGLDDEPETAAPTLTLEQVIDSAKLYAKTHGRDAAAKILQRFAVKSVRDIKPAQFAQAHKAFALR